MTPRPFTVHHSGFARDTLLAAVQAATLAGRRAEAVAAMRVMEGGLLWYADGFGESRQQLQLLGQLRVAVVLPITVWFAVDIVRWDVCVGHYRFVPRHSPGST